MATVVGEVSSISGPATAINLETGVSRVLTFGSLIYADEKIITAEGSYLTLTMTNGEEVSLDSLSELTLTADVVEIIQGEDDSTQQQVVAEAQILQQVLTQNMPQELPQLAPSVQTVLEQVQQEVPNAGEAVSGSALSAGVVFERLAVVGEVTAGFELTHVTFDEGKFLVRSDVVPDIEPGSAPLVAIGRESTANLLGIIGSNAPIQAGLGNGTVDYYRASQFQVSDPDNDLREVRISVNNGPIANLINLGSLLGRESFDYNPRNLTSTQKSLLGEFLSSRELVLQKDVTEYRYENATMRVYKDGVEQIQLDNRLVVESSRDGESIRIFRSNNGNISNEAMEEALAYAQPHNKSLLSDLLGSNISLFKGYTLKATDAEGNVAISHYKNIAELQLLQGYGDGLTSILGLPVVQAIGLGGLIDNIDNLTRVDEFLLGHTSLTNALVDTVNKVTDPLDSLVSGVVKGLSPVLGLVDKVLGFLTTGPIPVAGNEPLVLDNLGDRFLSVSSGGNSLASSGVAESPIKITEPLVIDTADQNLDGLLNATADALTGYGRAVPESLGNLLGDDSDNQIVQLLDAIPQDATAEVKLDSQLVSKPASAALSLEADLALSTPSSNELLNSLKSYS